MRRKFALVFIVTLLLASHGWLVRGAQDSSVSATQLERLAALGKLWGTVKFFHPYLAYKDIDWDAALIKAIPLVKAARTPDEYRQAVNTMLQALGDPATTVENPTTQPKRVVPNKAATELSYYRVQDAYVIATVTDWVAAMLTGQGKAAFDKAAALHAEAAKAKGLVLDCRFGGFAYADTPVTYLEFQLENNLLPGLLQGAAPLGTQRYRQHIGYTPQGVFGGDYSSSLVTTAPPAFFGRAREAKPLVVLFDDRTPDIVAHLGGLQAAGAKLVQVGPANVGAGAQLHEMQLAEGVRARVRVSEFIHPNGATTLQPDVQLSAEAGAGEPGIAAALAAFSAPAREKAAPAQTLLAAPQTVRDKVYPQMVFPPEEYRLLALFRFWNVIHYFFPYKHLTDQPWDSVLPEFIPRMLACKDALDYATAVAELAARIQDTHAWAVTGLYPLENKLGVMAPPLRVGHAAGDKLVVLELMDEAAAQAAGIQRGDVILTIDGEPVAQRLAALAKYRSLSTPQSAYAYVYPSALRGPPGSKAKLRIESGNGEPRDVEIARTVAYFSAMAAPVRRTPVYQVLPNGDGYIDLTRLQQSDAAQALDAVLNTPGLILDMRGYPGGDASALTARLTAKQNVTGLLDRYPLLTPAALRAAESGKGPTYVFKEYKLPAAQGAVYKGKVVMLINAHAISAAESACLIVEAATDVTFIGGPTVGADGAVTTVTLPGLLPGGISITFSGYDLRHADGRQLQRVGVQPHVKVEPTPQGIREGRDEVLERAFEYLKQNRQR